MRKVLHIEVDRKHGKGQVWLSEDEGSSFAHVASFSGHFARGAVLNHVRHYVRQYRPDKLEVGIDDNNTGKWFDQVWNAIADLVDEHFDLTVAYNRRVLA